MTLPNLKRISEAATPGPWDRYVEYHAVWGGVEKVVGNDPDEDGVVTLLHQSSGRHPGDAALIAAAPEMARLLQECADALQWLARNDANGWVKDRCDKTLAHLAEWDRGLA